ncbi:uncharacterized [Tachysurus ichikawai]
MELKMRDYGLHTVRKFRQKSQRLQQLSRISMALGYSAPLVYTPISSTLFPNARETRTQRTDAQSFWGIATINKLCKMPSKKNSKQSRHGPVWTAFVNPVMAIKAR